MGSPAVRRPSALTVCPPGSMTPRVVARNARRLSASEREVKPFQAADASALGRHPSPRTARPTVSTRSRTQLDAMTGRTTAPRRERRGPQQRTDGAPEATGGDEDERLDPLGEQVAELHGYATRSARQA